MNPVASRPPIGSRAPANVGEAVVQALLAQGCRHVFGLPGSHTLEIYGALARQDTIRHVTVKSESTVSFMADFYGRITGRPGICLLTAGPGAINSVNGVAQAFSAHSPMIHLTGSVPLDATLEAFHGVDDPEFTRKMFDPITKWSVRVTDAAEVPDVMAEAFRVATGGRPGPVHVEFPRLSDTQHHLITDTPPPIRPYGDPVVPARPVDERAVAELVDRLAAAGRVVVLAGKGVHATGSGPALGRIAATLDAPIVTDQEGIGSVHESTPHLVGYMSVWSLQPYVRGLLDGADVVLAAGVRPGTGVGRMLAASAGERVVYLDWVAGPASGTVVAGHVGETLAVLERRLAAAVGRRSDPAVLNAVQAYRSSVERERDELLARAAADPAVHPGAVVRTLANLIGERPATVVSDIGECSIWLRNYLPNRPNIRFLQSGMWGSMGCALPGAFVSGLLDSERLAIGVVGDGAMLMTLGDLGTFLEYGVRGVLVVLNDGKYQQISRALQRTEATEYGSTFENPDFAATAASFGALGLRVERLDELAPALSAALSADRLCVVDVQVQVGVPYPTFEFNTRPPSKG